MLTWCHFPKLAHSSIKIFQIISESAVQKIKLKIVNRIFTHEKMKRQRKLENWRKGKRKKREKSRANIHATYQIKISAEQP